MDNAIRSEGAQFVRLGPLWVRVEEIALVEGYPPEQPFGSHFEVCLRSGECHMLDDDAAEAAIADWEALTDRRPLLEKLAYRPSVERLDKVYGPETGCSAEGEEVPHGPKAYGLEFRERMVQMEAVLNQLRSFIDGAGGEPSGHLDALADGVGEEEFAEEGGRHQTQEDGGGGLDGGGLGGARGRFGGQEGGLRLQLDVGLDGRLIRFEAGLIG